MERGWNPSANHTIALHKYGNTNSCNILGRKMFYDQGKWIIELESFFVL